MASRWVWFIFQLPLMSGLRLATAAVDLVLPGLACGRPIAKRASPGRSPFSMNSSEAPPPVERWSTWSSRPNCLRALALSPPPTTEKPFVVATASATASVPAAKRGSSNTPMGPFQNTVAGRDDLIGKRSRRAGADVQAQPFLRHVRADQAHLAFRLPAGARRPRPATGQRCRSAAGSACPLPQPRRAGVRRCPIWLSSSSDPPVVALGGEEREAHPATRPAACPPCPARPRSRRACRRPWPRPARRRKAASASAAGRRGPPPRGPGPGRLPTAGTRADRRSRRAPCAPRQKRRQRRGPGFLPALRQRQGRWPLRPGCSGGSPAARPGSVSAPRASSSS